MEVVKIEEVIKVSKVYKSYQTELVLSDLNFKVLKGQIVGLLGPNGSGKTTTVRLLNGVITAEKGDIEILGLDPKKDGDKIRSLTGVLTESAGLYPHLSGEQNLIFFAELYNVKENVKDKTARLLTQFGLYEHRQKKVGSYSTGMKKRLGIAKALLHDPKILLLDEPTTGLDPEGARDLLNYIERLNKNKEVTILICTHILSQVEHLCHKFLFMASGKIIEAGTLQEIEDRYLTEFQVEIETEVKPESLSEDISVRLLATLPKRLIFKLEKKSDIPVLLKRILAMGPVYGCNILGRDLETMYFKIREAKK